MFRDRIIYKGMLNEISGQEEALIKDAINKVRRVRITYDDKKPNVISSRRGYKTRYILPVAFGLTKNGKKAVRAYQSAGSTKRGVPKWKLFLVDNIVSWTNSTRSFRKFKDLLIRLGLNTHGDKHMTTLYAITPFADKNVQVSKYDYEITPEPITKSEIEPSTKSQTPSNQTSRTISNISKINPQTIDNNQNLGYNKNIEAPETKPINKLEVEPKQPNTIPQEPNQNEPLTTEPITKSDINGEEENNGVEPQNNLRDNDFVRGFNDLTNRMNNLYNNEEENI